MKKLFVELLVGWLVERHHPGPGMCRQGLGKQHYWGFYVGNIKFSVLLESAPVPRRWLQSEPSAALGNLRVLPCFMQELKMMQHKAKEYILHLPSMRDIDPISMCWERPGCQNSLVLLRRLQVVIAF